MNNVPSQKHAEIMQMWTVWNLVHIRHWISLQHKTFNPFQTRPESLEATSTQYHHDHDHTCTNFHN